MTLETTRIAARPEDAGIDPEKLEALFERAQRDVDAGLIPSAQIAVARNGRIAGTRTIGSAVQGGSDKPATDDTLYCIYSCTKVVVASAVWLLLEEGLLRLDEKVADIIPEFGTNGKDVITVEQTMLHQGGFPHAPFAPDNWESKDARLEAFANWHLNWKPGTAYEYHSTSAHWVLAEIIERRTGVEYGKFIHDRIIEPMGLDDMYLGLPDALGDRFAEITWVGDQTPPPGGWTEVTPDAVMGFNKPHVRRAGVPGGGCVTNAAQIAMFYQVLLNGGATPEGRQLIKPETIEMALQVRNRMPDKIFEVPANRGLSIIIAGDDGKAFMRGFGHTVSPRAFGHGGAGGQISWGDPETGISLGFCTNGFNDWMTVGRRITALSSRAGELAL
jgi:CubicO group peptidase (beta-lactamase class C family)